VTNVAARLAALGEGDAVILGATTAQRLPSSLPVEDLGELRLRNVEAPVHAYRLPAPRTTAAAHAR
jgi:class 3 adenylate cyclase